MVTVMPQVCQAAVPIDASRFAAVALAMAAFRSSRVRGAEDQDHQDRGDEPGSAAREAEPIVLSLAELKKLAPELQPTTIVVTVTDAKTIEEDAAILQAEEVPSQIDDLDGNGTADELAFQVKLAPGRRGW